MKDIVKFEQGIGGDGGKVEGRLVVEGSDLKALVAVSYPIEKIIEPATKAVDSMLTKLEAAIPGDWDKPMIEHVKSEYKKELMKLLAEDAAPSAPAQA